MIFTKTFWLEALERGVKTASQALLLLWGAAEGFNLLEANWEIAAGFGLGGFALSILMSIVSAPFGRNNSPSLVKGEAGLDVGREPQPQPIPRHLSQVDPDDSGIRLDPNRPNL